jgi:hypothetical protein
MVDDYYQFQHQQSTNLPPISSEAERLRDRQQVKGSNPLSATKFYGGVA